MTASICWRPVNPQKDHCLSGVGAPSSFIETLEKAFGDLPVKLTETAIPKLDGMAIVTERDDKTNPYRELIEAIEKHSIVEIYAVW